MLVIRSLVRVGRGMTTPTSDKIHINCATTVSCRKTPNAMHPPEDTPLVANMSANVTS